MDTPLGEIEGQSVRFLGRGQDPLTKEDRQHIEDGFLGHARVTDTPPQGPLSTRYDG